MATIGHLISNTRKLDITEAVRSTMVDTQTTLVAEQQQQMLEGKASTGAKIGKYANKAYRRKKFSMNPLAGMATST
jgi:hypothetical protein